MRDMLEDHRRNHDNPSSKRWKTQQRNWADTDEWQQDGQRWWGEDEGWDEYWEPGAPDHTARQATEATEGEVDDDTLAEIDDQVAQAEALVAEHQRTLTQAREAQSVARRDRGFGKVAAASSSSTVGPCFTRQGNHLLRDCPLKGKGTRERFFLPEHLLQKQEQGQGEGQEQGQAQVSTLHAVQRRHERPV
jgi:hypothetical protein